MSIVPDTKDWTWVLTEPCPDCGLDAGSVAAQRVGPRLLAELPRWDAVLSRPDAGTRPAPDTWSPSEYGCHVRDVCVVFGERVRLMLAEDDPVLAGWDQDEAAVADDYAAQDPGVVSAQLVRAGRRLAATFESVPDEAWDRGGRRSDGSAFTIRTLARYLLHDYVHHLHDVRG